MVVRIQPAHSKVANTIAYNERKVEEGKASVVGFSEGINSMEEFNAKVEELSRGRVRDCKDTFHASINPGPTDGFNDDKALSFARELMDELGYAGQPFVLYRHDDTDRTHYHIVSSRIGPDGKKIDDSLEGVRCARIMEKLAEKYGFSIGNPKDESQVKERDASERKEAENGEEKPKKAKQFDRNNPDVSGQMKRILEEALQYRFANLEQYKVILRSMGVRMELTKGQDFTLYGTFRGKPCTVGISAKDLGFSIGDVNEAILRSKKSEEQDKGKREKIANLAAYALAHGKSMEASSQYAPKAGD